MPFNKGPRVQQNSEWSYSFVWGCEAKFHEETVFHLFLKVEKEIEFKAEGALEAQAESIEWAWWVALQWWCWEWTRDGGGSGISCMSR